MKDLSDIFVKRAEIKLDEPRGAMAHVLSEERLTNSA